MTTRILYCGRCGQRLYKADLLAAAVGVTCEHCGANTRDVPAKVVRDE